MIMSINCLLLGDYSSRDTFSVNVSDINTIGTAQVNYNDLKINDLKHLIWDNRKDTFVDFNSGRINLWKVNIALDEIAKLKDVTEKQIKDHFSGEELTPVCYFKQYFQKVDPKNIHIIVVFATDLGKKRPIMEEKTTEATELKRSKWNTRKWDTNGAIRKAQRTSVYFVDPLVLSSPLLNNIRKGEFMALHGARATGKTTRVFRVIEQLEEEGYFCLYITFEMIEMKKGEEMFWSSFGKYLIMTAPEHIKNHIKSGIDFASLFSISKWEKKVILFIDEYDVMYTANDETISSFLKVVRGIKARKEEYAILSINVVGPFSILYLSSEEVATSSFNIKKPFQNPNFTQEQVQFLFKEYADEVQITINQDVIKDIYMRTDGHAGLVTNCGKAIDEKLKKELDKSFTLNISTWLKFTASNRLEGTILNYETFRKMVQRLVENDIFRPAVDLLQYSFIGFLGSVRINDSIEKKKADSLTAEGVLAVVNKDDNIYRMSSAFMDEMMRRRVISDLYKSCPESAIPKKHDLSLDILNILQTAIQFFDKDIIYNAFDRSYKVAYGLYVDGKKKNKVPRESVYNIELNRILVNWLVKKGGFEVTGQWHMVENCDGENEHSYSDIVITTDCQNIVLELLATATKKDLNEHFVRVLKYAELLSANDIWIVHFTCEDGYATQKLQWPPDDRINVVHFYHDQTLNVIMNARYAESTGTIGYIVDQVVPLLS